MSPRHLASARSLTAGVAFVALAALVAGCAGSDAGDPTADETVTLQVGAVTSPMTDIVEAAAGEIGDGYEIELVEVSDYVTINNMLAAGDIDANFSQHLPYMEEFNEKNDAELEALTSIYNFALAFYSKEYDDLADLPDGAQIAIPNDSSNTARALKMLAGEGLIELDGAIDPYDATVDDITENPKDLEFLQLEINQLNTAYDESDLVFQWPSHIAALGLTPQDDGLISEIDPRFALQLVVNGATADTEMIEALEAAFTSDAVRAVIDENETIEAAF